MHSSAALLSRCSMKARSARMSSTSPTMPTRGMPSVKPIARAPSIDVGLPDQPLGLGVGDVVDARALDPFVDPALVGGVVVHARRSGVPVEVVLGDVEDGGRLGAHRVGVVQLEAGQLDREHVVRLGVHHGLDDRQPDVADCDAAQSRGAQDRVEHLHRRGLAVGAGHAEPRGARGSGRAAATRARPRPTPGCRERSAWASSGAVGFQPGRRHHDVDVVGQRRGGACPEPYVGAEHLEQLGLLGPVAGVASRRVRRRSRRGG